MIYQILLLVKLELIIWGKKDLTQTWDRILHNHVEETNENWGSKLELSDDVQEWGHCSQMLLDGIVMERELPNFLFIKFINICEITKYIKVPNKEGYK